MAKNDLHLTRNIRYHGSHRCRKNHNPGTYFVYTGLTHKIGEVPTVPLQWTGWSKSRNRYHYHLLQPPLPVGNMPGNTYKINLIDTRDTLTLPLRWNVLCVFLMAPLLLTVQ